MFFSVVEGKDFIDIQFSCDEVQTISETLRVPLFLFRCDSGDGLSASRMCFLNTVSRFFVSDFHAVGESINFPLFYKKPLPSDNLRKYRRLTRKGNS